MNGSTVQAPGSLLGVRRNLVICGGIAALVCVATGIALTRSSQTERAAAVAPISVSGDRVDIHKGSPTWGYIELTPATVGAPIPPAPVPGRVAVDETRSGSVVAPLAGRVDAVPVRIGQRVGQGERLLSVRSAALVDLFHEIDLMRSKETARTKAIERLRALVQLKATPEKELIAAEQDLRQAQLARQAGERKLRSLSVDAANEGLFWITAPRAGVIVEKNVLIGQEVGPDRGDPLFVIAELDEVIVAADVPESDVVGVQVGQPATIASSAIPDRELSGTVEHVGEIVDPVRHMVNVRVRVPNPDQALRPNAFVQVNFAPDSAPRVLAAADAVVTDDQQAFVFVQPPDRPTSLERQAVVVGRQRDGKIEILKGLEPGQTYVSRGAILLLNAIDLAK